MTTVVAAVMGALLIPGGILALLTLTLLAAATGEIELHVTSGRMTFTWEHVPRPSAPRVPWRRRLQLLLASFWESR